MRVLGSITNRIFLASALLAMLSIAAAVYFISNRMTSETEAELQGDLHEAATLVPLRLQLDDGDAFDPGRDKPHRVRKWRAGELP